MAVPGTRMGFLRGCYPRASSVSLAGFSGPGFDTRSGSPTNLPRIVVVPDGFVFDGGVCPIAVFAPWCRMRPDSIQAAALTIDAGKRRNHTRRHYWDHCLFTRLWECWACSYLARRDVCRGPYRRDPLAIFDSNERKCIHDKRKSLR